MTSEYDPDGDISFGGFARISIAGKPGPAARETTQDLDARMDLADLMRLASLDDQDRQAVMEIYGHERSARAAVKIIGKTHDTIWRRARNAMIRLRAVSCA